MRGKGLVIECLDHSNYIISTTFQFRCNLAARKVQGHMGHMSCSQEKLPGKTWQMPRPAELPPFYDFCTSAGVPWLQRHPHHFVCPNPQRPKINMRHLYKFNKNSSNKQHPRKPVIWDGGPGMLALTPVPLRPRKSLGFKSSAEAIDLGDLGGHWSLQFWVIFVGSSYIYILYTVSKCIHHQDARKGMDFCRTKPCEIRWAILKFAVSGQLSGSFQFAMLRRFVWTCFGQPGRLKTKKR